MLAGEGGLGGPWGRRGQASCACRLSLAARPAQAGAMRAAGAAAGAKWEPLGRGRGGVQRRKGEGGCHTPLFSLESGSGGGRPGKCLFVGPENVQGLAQGPSNVIIKNTKCLWSASVTWAKANSHGRSEQIVNTGPSFELL